MVHREVGVDPQLIPLLWSLVRILIVTGVLLVVLGAANLANLFVFRAIRRGPESALRRALGASRFCGYSTTKILLLRLQPQILQCLKRRAPVGM
jgi:hypothetical protein